MLLKRRDFLLQGTAVATTAALPAHAAQDAPEDPFAARVVRVAKGTVPNRIHVIPDDFALYLTLPDERAIRYSVGVAQRHLWEPGTFIIKAKKEWPSWTPTPEMIERNPKQYERWKDGMPGGPSNPLGARALYLFRMNGGDSFLRIHGTNDPSTIGTRVSNGCARLTNGYIVDLYDRVELDTIVHLHPMSA